jgi:hypothetical protein
MTPRERRENAKRNATRGPIYEGIGFGILILVAFLIGGPAKPPTTPGGIPLAE